MAQGKNKPLYIIGGVSCLFLLCVGLLVGGSIYFLGDQIELLIADLQQTSSIETVEPPPSTTQEPTEEILSTVETETTETATPPSTAEPEATPTEESRVKPTSDGKPRFGPIIFALGTTEDYEPIDPAFIFSKSITEVHAIFDYSGMTPDLTWERVWYLDDEEILKNSAPWTGDEAGRFDYYIDANGDPLFPGDWELELYVGDQLLSKGTFTIEGAEEDTEEDEEATPATVESPQPTSTLAVMMTHTPSSLSDAGSATTATPDPDSTPTAETTPIPVARSNQVYQLAFTKWDGGKHNLYVADTDGDNMKFLISRAAGPSWTPDGHNLFFYGEQAIDRQIVDGIEYTFDGISDGIVSMRTSPMPDNISEIELYQGLDWKQGRARWANVSPNGKMVAFDSNHSGNYRIYFLGTAESEAYRYEIIGEQGDWSPDSEKIVYRSGRGGVTGIWISNRDDSGHRLLTDEGSDSFPAWSPDGETVAFSREINGDVEIYTINVDGTDLTRLTESPGPDTLPTYTPDGDIIFRSTRSGGWGIWKMSGSGANQEEIISNAPVGPDWSFSRMDVH